MQFIDEYRDAAAAGRYAEAIRKITTRPWKIMEICGGQTHTIVKYGIDKMLPDQITLIHGPGCPVCVTPIELIDQAIAVAYLPNTVLCSFGDMLRVPGSKEDLFSAKSKGADVRIVYSPLDALRMAREETEKEIIFFAVGFETTAPANAMAVFQAKQDRIKNFSVLVSHVLVPPAMEAILSSPENQVQGFLAAGHVCTIMGYTEYEPIAAKYGVPIVVTGFEPLDILQGVLMCVTQLESGKVCVENQYLRSVTRGGNRPAQDLLREIFCVVPRKWRGVGEIPASGLGLRPPYECYDAARKFDIAISISSETDECISGLILQGRKKPNECPAFGTTCIPEKPLGAPMVSSEGACAAYFRYRNMGTVPQLGR